MMKFGETPLSADKIYAGRLGNVIAVGLTAVRADEKESTPNLFENVLTYLHGCRFGIAVFERLVGDEFNPNVFLELGYMLDDAEASLPSQISQPCETCTLT